MQGQPTPMATEIPADVPMPKAPLVRVLAQIRFPPILSIGNESSVADFQEALRADYPYLRREEVGSFHIMPGQSSNISRAVIWRLSDRQEQAIWCVSLGVDFIALETSRYSSRDDFLGRLRAVLKSVETYFYPAEARRVGLRYINRLEREAVERVSDLICPGVWGIMQPSGGTPDSLRNATAHLMTQAQLLAVEGVIQGRWGSLTANATYDPDVLQPITEVSWVLDLDMFAPNALPFRSEAFAKRIYSVFRMMVTDNFLKFYGGTP